MSIGRDSPRGLQLLWPALAGIIQAASMAMPGSGQAHGWLQILSMTLLASGLAKIARPGFRTRSAHRQAAWFGGVFAAAWLAGSFWWLYVSMHDVGGLPAPLAVLAVMALSSALALYYAAACAVWVNLAQGLVGSRPGAASALFAALWTLSELMRGRWLTGFLGRQVVMRMSMASCPFGRLGLGCMAWAHWRHGWPCGWPCLAGACAL